MSKAIATTCPQLPCWPFPSLLTSIHHIFLLCKRTAKSSTAEPTTVESHASYFVSPRFLSCKIITTTERNKYIDTDTSDSMKEEENLHLLRDRKIYCLYFNFWPSPLQCLKPLLLPVHSCHVGLFPLLSLPFTTFFYYAREPRNLVSRTHPQWKV